MGTAKKGQYILNLEGVTRGETALVGTKAANLGELVKAGFPVPDGFVLTTTAFDQFLKINSLDSNGPPVGGDSLDLPEEVANALLERAAELHDTPLAVRSSGIAEDLPGASFAGQYETVLDVRGEDALLKAVEKCWSSAFSDGVREYRKTQGQDGSPGMAVLIQRLVEADAAGVAFTTNPVSGDRSETVVSAVRGLGDRLVSGQTTPDDWIVKDGEATCQHAPEGAIDAALAVDIANLAKRTEAHFNGPQDIEWAIARGKLFLLQARPVTALDQEGIEPVTVPVEVPDGFWEREATHAPHPWTPMTSSILFPMRNRSLKRAFDEFGLLIETLEMREIGGWEYARLVPFGGKDRPTPPAWLFWLMTRLVPQMRARIKHCVKAMRSEEPIRVVRRWHAEWQPALEDRIATLREADLGSLTNDELYDHTAKTIALFEKGNNIHFLLHGALAIILGELGLTCRILLGWRDDQAFDMLNGLSEKSTEPSIRLADLARLAQEHPTIENLLEDVGTDTLERMTEVEPRFGGAFRDYMREYGCRALRYEIGDPSLVESPVLVLRLLKAQLDQGYDPLADALALERKRRTTVEEARSALSHRSSQERERFERVLAHAEEAYPVREDNEFYTFSAPIAFIRYALLEIGRRMTQRGQIEDQDDIFFLKIDEAMKAISDESNRKKLVKRRKGERAWVLGHPGPASYGKEPGPPPSSKVLPVEARLAMDAVLWSMERVFANEHVRQAESAEGALHGIPASPGTYQGTVRVIMDESEFSKLEAGDVLVCPVTSPVWSVLFPGIGALVTDTGGVLSHPAIIAREYQVPAVVATGRATRMLVDGQKVLVDGSSGTVELMP